jgi:hypothetical protein
VTTKAVEKRRQGATSSSTWFGTVPTRLRSSNPWKSCHLAVLSAVVFVCVNALPAAVFEFFPVLSEARTFAAFSATLGLVCFDRGMD